MEPQEPPPGSLPAVPPDTLPAEPRRGRQVARAGWVTAPSAPDRRPFLRRHLGALVFMGIVVAAIVAGVVWIAQSAVTVEAIISRSNGEITWVNVPTPFGQDEWVAWAAVGVGPGSAASLACDVVAPALASSGHAGAAFVVLDRAGDVIASDRTPCTPTPAPAPAARLGPPGSTSADPIPPGQTARARDWSSWRPHRRG